MTPQEKETNLINYFKKIYPKRLGIDRDSLVNPNQNTRIRDIAYSKDLGAYTRIVDWAEKRLQGAFNPGLSTPPPTSKHLEVEQALSKFRPRFGNTDDIHIIDLIGKYREVELHVNELEKRRQQIKTENTKRTKKQQELIRLQAQLLTMLGSVK